MSGPLDVLRDGITPFHDSEEVVVDYERGGYSYSQHKDDCRKCAAEAALAAVGQLARDVEYVEGVLSRDPFDETQRKFAAELLRAALARFQAGSPARPEGEAGQRGR